MIRLAGGPLIGPIFACGPLERPACENRLFSLAGLLRCTSAKIDFACGSVKELHTKIEVNFCRRC